MRRWLAPGIVVAVAAALGAVLVAGGSDAAKPKLRPITATSPAFCFSVAKGAREVRFPVGKSPPLVGAVLGSGPVGVVLAHQAESTLCQWLYYAEFLARKGYRVLAFDFSLDSTRVPADDASVAAAARTVRALGSHRVVLMGASRGGSAVLAAARLFDAAGLVALSPPEEYNGSDALGGVIATRAPLLLAVGDQDFEFTGGVSDLFRHAKSPAKRLIVKRNSPEHGVELLREPGGTSRIDAAILALLRKV
jgi:pimeloyl-ACP methyl ester carboxylesterase